MKSLIFGAGTYGEVYLAYLREAGIDIVGFIDDNESLWGSDIRGIKVLGGREILPKLLQTEVATALYCPIGNNKLRVEVLSQAKDLGYAIPNYIHPSVILSPNIIMGEGIYILLGSCIMPYTQIDDYVMISMAVNIAHHVHLHQGVFISTGGNIGASMSINEYAYLGMNVTAMTGLKVIGSNSLLGAGSVIIKDVPDNAIMAGVPAKLLRYQS